MFEIRNALGVLCCPECDAALSAVTKCTQCGTEYEALHHQGRHVPVLLPKSKRRSISYEVTTQTTNPTKSNLERVLRYPERHGYAADLPYHMDQAYADTLTRLPKGSIVLEIGCGGGQSRRWMESQGLRYIGTDISTDRVFDWLKKQGGPDIICDAHFLPIASQSIDAVYATSVIEHLASPTAAFQEFHRVLKPGGVVIADCSFLEPWHDYSYFHLTPLGIHETLRQSGMEIQAVWPEKNYTGYYAMMMMGNAGTQMTSAIGWLIGRWYYLSLRLRDIAKRRGWQSGQQLIHDNARISGTINFIATKS
jgi:ubiquinone/menaquinone biosynthesis C-methylase UbiE